MKLEIQDPRGHWLLGCWQGTIRHRFDSDTVKEQVIVIFTTDMPEKEIENIIINGVLRCR
ncbi:MAG: hypothetical protein R3F38_14165 [Gammaproteobacteria bacterium]